MHPALLYVPGRRLSLSELSAARLDGHVVELGDAYIPADLTESADVRASSIAALVRPGTAAAGPTAAWIHGAGDTPPAVHHIRRSVPRRVRPQLSRRVIFHDGPLREGEVIRLGDIDVATPLRTMLDLATGVHRDPRLREWIERLALSDPALVTESIDAMTTWNRVPGSRIGRAVLERLALRRS
ncbi:hypothetical protein KZC51_11915 [Microbacterium sp. SSW1-49]|uniref:AbiEi antitoxin C-terminal domain-containing protein n=1 Tax=Microbacterium croceum TaxID=2851645 RepID=A0ABT0FGF2_9MICO|nr:hypothetical protein [Microbacterium croceum]MCK2036841.1 hypothetical protein [Microbacterium croceum]